MSDPSAALVTEECRRGLHGDCLDWHDTYCDCPCHQANRERVLNVPNPFDPAPPHDPLCVACGCVLHRHRDLTRCSDCAALSAPSGEGT
jgi:hypothetical protein